MLISGADNKREFAARVIGGSPSMEDVVQKIAELEYLEEIQVYKLQRSSEYPDWGSQLDYIYHNGVDLWKTNIVDPVKAMYPKVEIDETELNNRKAQALHDYQLDQYTKAQERLSQYQVALGREEQTKEIIIDQEWNEETQEIIDITETVVSVPSIDPVDATIEQTTYEGGITTIENPLITQDNAERAEAQAVVDATPSAVVDAYNAL